MSQRESGSSVRPRTFALLVGLLLVLVPVGPGATASRNLEGDPRLVVSFTFDGTDRSQDDFSEILAEHGMAGTFYVNSGLVGYPAYLNLTQLRSIARDRNEIAGASADGLDLTTVSAGEARRQICDDRSTLAQLGFQVTSFAYPRGAVDDAVVSAVRSCGYNSARDFAGLYDTARSCGSCPDLESLPPDDVFRIRTASELLTLRALKARVLRAERSGPGWLPLTFSKLCLCPGDQPGAVTRDTFTAFVVWLAKQDGTVVVRTVDQVVGGALRPVHGSPSRRLVPAPSAAISAPEPPSRVPAWTLAGVDIGQAQILFTGLVVSVAMVVTYRLATRKERHAH